MAEDVGRWRRSFVTGMGQVFRMARRSLASFLRAVAVLGSVSDGSIHALKRMSRPSNVSA